MSSSGNCIVSNSPSLARAAGLTHRGEDSGCGEGLLTCIGFLLSLEAFFHTPLSIVLKELIKLFSSSLCFACFLYGSFLCLISVLISCDSWMMGFVIICLTTWQVRAEELSSADPLLWVYQHSHLHIEVCSVLLQKEWKASLGDYVWDPFGTQSIGLSQSELCNFLALRYGGISFLLDPSFPYHYKGNIVVKSHFNIFSNYSVGHSQR